MKGTSYEQLKARFANTLTLRSPLRKGDGLCGCSVSVSDIFSSQGCAMGYFIPASGQATRMLSPLYAGEAKTLSFDEIATRLRDVFPVKVRSWIDVSELRAILEKYKTYPKILLPWHVYEDEGVSVCWKEHIAEAVGYVEGTRSSMAVHFTVSETLWKDFEVLLESFSAQDVVVSCSVQDPKTHSVAFYRKDLKEVCDTEGRQVRYPSGHGAVLPSLQAMASEKHIPLVFIKTVDNVSHRARRKKVGHSLSAGFRG